MITKIGNTLVNQPGLLERNPALGIGLGAAAGTLGTGLGGAYLLKKKVLPNVFRAGMGTGAALGAGAIGLGALAKKFGPQLMKQFQDFAPTISQHLGNIGKVAV